MTGSDPRHVPAAGRRGLEWLYDPVVAVTMREHAVRAAIGDLALTTPVDGAIVDVGCGTGSQLIALAHRDHSRRLIGVDVDAGILNRARAKLAAAGVNAELLRGDAGTVPLEDHLTAAAISSLVLHHLPPHGKRAALRELVRVVCPGGRVIVLDWGEPVDLLTRTGFRLLRALDGYANTADHAAGRLPTLIGDAGLDDVRRDRSWRTVWGSLELWTGTAPARLANDD